tara:strand:+ start:1822 stop:2277 length:456 start_codon:yes stop_codon:yes gene_type:complete
MKKIAACLILLTTISCTGYEPIFSTKNFNFYIDEIINTNEDKISKKIEKKLINYRLEDINKKKYIIKISSKKKEIIISKDSKGDPLIYELQIESNLEVILEDKTQHKIKLSEKFNFNNQSNKFELKQYKKKIEQNLIDIMSEKLIIRLQSL